MILSLIRKDMRLLRNYLRLTWVVTSLIYLVTAVGVYWLTHYQDESMQSLKFQTFLTLRGGSSFGMGASVFLSAAIAGSLFTLERADRSAEFLACLPPTRIQHLISKLSILVGTTGLLFCIHIACSATSDALLPYVRTNNYGLADRPMTSTIFVSGSVSVLMVGTALAVSAWLNSNGPPILFGLLSPIVLISIIHLIGYCFNIPTANDDFPNRFMTASLWVGICLGLCGCYWYVERVEP